MTVVTANTYDPLERYVSVRMQQNVPLVDADWNEREDARQFEAGSAIRWTAGDGAAFDDDGFRIDGTGAVDDFTIRAGIATAGGMQPAAAADVAFRSQPLHVSQAGAAALAAKLHTQTIDELPPGPATVLVYLDAWERYVAPAEDGTLVLPGVGTESCGRTKLEWAVRAVPGIALPIATAGHVFLELARIERQTGVTAVNAADVTDRRERALLVPPAALLADCFGTAGTADGATVAAYRAGTNRPPISFRAALNALLLDSLPATAEVELQQASGLEELVWPALDEVGGLVGVLLSDRANPGSGNLDAYLTRAALDDPAAGWATPAQVSSGVMFSYPPMVVATGGGNLLLAYGIDSNRVAFRAGTYPAIATAGETVVATGTPDATTVAVTGTTAIFVWYENGAAAWRSRRRDLAGAAWLDGAPVAFVGAASTSPEAAKPVVDAVGVAWFALLTTAGVQVQGMRADGTLVTPPLLSPAAISDDPPAVAVAPDGDVWCFFKVTAQGPWFAVLHGGVWTTGPVPHADPDDAFVQAVADPTAGGLWVSYQRGTTQPRTYLRWLNTRLRTWAPPRAVTDGTHLWELYPSLAVEPDGALWLAWNAMTTFPEVRTYLKRIYTRV